MFVLISLYLGSLVSGLMAAYLFARGTRVRWVCALGAASFVLFVLSHTQTVQLLP